MAATRQNIPDSYIILINVLGEDQPAVIVEITRILSEYQATVLDIGQSVIHDHLNLGMLVLLADNCPVAQLQQELTQAAAGFDNHIQFETVTNDRYAVWVEQQGKPRHLVTLLARQVRAEHITALTAIATEQGLQFDGIRRLSGRIPVDALVDHSRSSMVFSVRGVPRDAAELRTEFMALSSRFDIDIAVQTESILHRHRRLVCFDMDSTLITAEVIDELAKEAGVGEQVAQITEAAMAGELDFNQSFARRMALLNGLDESVLQTVAERLVLTEGAERLFNVLRHLGYKTAILSGGFDYFARFLQSKLGIDYIYANQLDIVDGKVTGEVTGTVVNGERKAQLLRELAAKENIRLEQVIAVGDGANDLPMLSIAGLGIAFRAKPLVRASAKQSISQLGLDAILYLMGLSDQDIALLE